MRGVIGADRGLRLIFNQPGDPCVVFVLLKRRDQVRKVLDRERYPLFGRDPVVAVVGLGPATNVQHRTLFELLHRYPDFASSRLGNRAKFPFAIHTVFLSVAAINPDYTARPPVLGSPLVA